MKTVIYILILRHASLCLDLKHSHWKFERFIWDSSFNESFVSTDYHFSAVQMHLDLPRIVR